MALASLCAILNTCSICLSRGFEYQSPRARWTPGRLPAADSKRCQLLPPEWDLPASPPSPPGRGDAGHEKRSGSTESMALSPRLAHQVRHAHAGQPLISQSRLASTQGGPASEARWRLRERDKQSDGAKDACVGGLSWLAHTRRAVVRSSSDERQKHDISLLTTCRTTSTMG